MLNKFFNFFAITTINILFIFFTSLFGEDLDKLKWADCCKDEFYQSMVQNKNWESLKEAMIYSKNKRWLTTIAARDPNIPFYQFDEIFSWTGRFAGQDDRLYSIILHGVLNRHFEDLSRPKESENLNDALYRLNKWVQYTNDWIESLRRIDPTYPVTRLMAMLHKAKWIPPMRNLLIGHLESQIKEENFGLLNSIMSDHYALGKLLLTKEDICHLTAPSDL